MPDHFRFPTVLLRRKEGVWCKPVRLCHSGVRRHGSPDESQIPLALQLVLLLFFFFVVVAVVVVLRRVFFARSRLHLERDALRAHLLARLDGRLRHRLVFRQQRGRPPEGRLRLQH